MAEQDGDKSQEATPYRRQQAQEQGQVARSADLSAAVLLLAGLMTLSWIGPGLGEYHAQLFREFLGETPMLTTDGATITHQLARVAMGVATAVMPLLGALLVFATMPTLLQVGFHFLPEKLALNPSHLDPLRGFQRLFSLTSVVRLGMGLVKIVIVGAVGGVCLYNERDALLGLAALPPLEIAGFLSQMLLSVAIKIAVALLVLAILDYGFQWWKQEQDLRMTTQEVREEMKNLQGDPQIIARRRAIQRQLVLNRLKTAVPKADVVVTNPTELAVAIQYDAEKMLAPIVVAKGAGLMAQRIRLLALEHGIPIVEKKPLAQALFRDVDVNHPIPREMYAAVAELLAYVYQLKGKPMPKPPGAQAA
ncbi:MAG: EscU/YscU/HrcU family type III secretion system export apparatus switch protein [Pirellulales bacterium]|nr:EscU/YscU/HrcU family type III secretion system export apparatus switch protein [Pirellulales bacterium]